MDLSYDLDPERAAQIGLIVLQQDETIERDMRRLMPRDVEMLVSRVPSGLAVTPDSLAQMESVLTGAARLLPVGARCRAVGYGCTSGTAEIGPARIHELLLAGVTTPDISEPVSALIAACRALKIARIGMVSPYIETVSDKLCAVLTQADITVTRIASFNEAEEAQVARIAPQSITDAALQIASDCDAVFLSCTNLRALDIIDPLEAATDKPVLSSNLVLAWHLLRLCGIPPRKDAPGRLWVDAS